MDDYATVAAWRGRRRLTLPLPGHGGYTGGTMPERDSIKTGERRTATILFSDMKGFTSLSERSDPEVMDSLMTRVFDVFEELIKGYGGFVEKYIGDALVAVFGVPELHEDDPSRAIHAALEFLARVKDLGAGAAGSPLAFRTGIHEGLVTTGRRGDFDVVTGHAMSVAQRLEAAASPGSILVSEAVKEKCEEDFDFSQRLDIEARGKTEPIAAYEVRGESQADARGGGREIGAFVGRRDLVDELLKAYMRKRGDEVSGFFLTGEAGMGKSRLLQAFVDKLRRTSKLVVLQSEVSVEVVKESSKVVELKGYPLDRKVFYSPADIDSFIRLYAIKSKMAG